MKNDSFEKAFAKISSRYRPKPRITEETVLEIERGDVGIKIGQDEEGNDILLKVVYDWGYEEQEVPDIELRKVVIKEVDNPNYDKEIQEFNRIKAEFKSKFENEKRKNNRNDKKSIS